MLSSHYIYRYDSFPQPQFYNADQYAKRLVGNAYSIPVVDIILRRLQGMFASKRYTGYTYAFEWKDSGPEIHDDDDESSVSDDDDKAQLFPTPTAVASMPNSHPQQQQQQQQHDEENQKSSANNVCVSGKEEVRPKREDDDQKPPAHDDDDGVINDEKESPTARVLLKKKNQKNPPALQVLSGREEILKKSSLPNKPRIAKAFESEIPRPNNPSPSCHVRGLSEELEDI